jgi:biopolymer transport protein TolR
MGASNNSGKSRVVLSEINVTPLVDVMLVLLIIFMVTAPMMKQGIEVNLPETTSTGMSTNDKPYILVIRQNETIFVGSEEISLNNLKDKIKFTFETTKNKQLYIQADKLVNYGVVAEAMAEIRAAGIFNIGLVTLPKAK